MKFTCWKLPSGDLKLVWEKSVCVYIFGKKNFGLSRELIMDMESILVIMRKLLSTDQMFLTLW